MSLKLVFLAFADALRYPLALEPEHPQGLLDLTHGESNPLMVCSAVQGPESVTSPPREAGVQA